MISEHDPVRSGEFAGLAKKVRSTLEKRSSIEGTAIADFITAVEQLLSMPPHEESDIAAYAHDMVHDRLRKALDVSSSGYRRTVQRAIPDSHMAADAELLLPGHQVASQLPSYETFVRSGASIEFYDNARATAKTSMLNAIDSAHEVPEVGDLAEIHPDEIAMHIKEELADLAIEIDQLCDNIEQAFVHNSAIRRWVRSRQPNKPDLDTWTYDKRDRIALNKRMKAVIEKIQSLSADPLTHHGANIVSTVAERYVRSYLAGTSEDLNERLVSVLDDLALSLQAAVRHAEPLSDVPEVTTDHPSPSAPEQQRKVPEMVPEVFERTELTATFEWIDDAERPIGKYTNPYGQFVYYIDGRSSRAVEIEEKHKDAADVRDTFHNRWVTAIRSHAGEVAPNTYSTVRKGDGFSSEYSSLAEIRYNNNKQPNVPRVYFAQLRLSDISDGIEAGDEPDGNVVVLLGRCTKDTQIRMLSLFTNRTKRQLREFGAGSK